MRSFLTGFEHRFVPKRSLSSVVLSHANSELAKSAVEMDKAKKILNGQWGFEVRSQHSELITTHIIVCYPSVRHMDILLYPGVYDEYASLVTTMYMRPR